MFWAQALLGATLWKACEFHVKTMWKFHMGFTGFSHGISHIISQKCEIPCEMTMWNTCEIHVKRAPHFHMAFHRIACEKPCEQICETERTRKVCILWKRMWKILPCEIPCEIGCENLNGYKKRMQFLATRTKRLDLENVLIRSRKSLA